MPRRSPASNAAEAPQRATGPYIVLNPRHIPKGRHIISYPGRCLNCHKPHKGHTAKPCENGYQAESVQRWYEGDAWEPHEDSDVEGLLRWGVIAEGRPASAGAIESEGDDG